MPKAICRVVEIKGDGTDSDYIEFGPFDFTPRRLKFQFTPPPPNLDYYGNWDYEYSMDGESWLPNGLWLSQGGVDINLFAIDLEYNGGTFVRLPLAQFINKGYVGRIAMRLDFYQ